MLRGLEQEQAFDGVMLCVRLESSDCRVGGHNMCEGYWLKADFAVRLRPMVASIEEYLRACSSYFDLLLFTPKIFRVAGPIRLEYSYGFSLSTVVILGIAFRRSSLSFSVGTKPSCSSTLSDTNMPKPAYAMIEAPMTMRVLGVMLLYQLYKLSACET
jgi:hypothetical protein